MLRTWLSTVCSEMNRRAPISLLLRPSATSRATSASRFASNPAPALSAAAAGDLAGFAECEPHGGVPAQPASGLELGLEPGCAKRRDRRRFGLAHQRSKEWHDAGAGPRAHGIRGSEQLRGEPRLPGSGGMAAQCVQQVRQLYPVIDLLGDPQRLGEQGL